MLLQSKMSIYETKLAEIMLDWPKLDIKLRSKGKTEHNYVKKGEKASLHLKLACYFLVVQK